MIEKSLSKKAQYKTWQTDDYILYRYKNYLNDGGTMDLEEFKDLYFGDWHEDEQAAAARFVFALVPMNKFLWETHYSEIAPQGVRRNDLVGLIEAKSNYSGLSENIFWLEKNIITIDTIENTQEETNVFTASELTEAEEQRFKKYEEINKEKILQQIHHIKSFFKLTSEVIKNIEDRTVRPLELPLNQLVEYMANRDPEYQNAKVEFKTIKSRYHRLITALADHPMKIPNTKLQFAYRYDSTGGKVKHKISIETEPGEEPWC